MIVASIRHHLQWLDLGIHTLYVHQLNLVRRSQILDLGRILHYSRLPHLVQEHLAQLSIKTAC